MATYSYCRVSTNAQAEEGQSLGAQQRVCAGYATMLGFTVDRDFVERAVSGSVPLQEREAGSDLLAILRTGDVVITPKLDRMFRSAADALHTLAQLQKRGVSLHMIDLGGDVTNNGVSKLVFTILSAVAESERDRIRERVRDIKADQRQRGRYLGGTLPFGYRLDDQGALVEKDDEQAAIALMLRLKREGLALRTIRDAVVAETGLKISHVAIGKILARHGEAVEKAAADLPPEDAQRPAEVKEPD